MITQCLYVMAIVKCSVFANHDAAPFTSLSIVTVDYFGAQFLYLVVARNQLQRTARLKISFCQCAPAFVWTSTFCRRVSRETSAIICGQTGIRRVYLQRSSQTINRCWFRAASLLMIPFASTRPAVRGCQLRNQLRQAIGIIKPLRGGRDL
jgi:hypothetical protein